MKNIKLIASDVDGTLLPEGSADINPEIFEIIRKLKERGILFVAASGRHYSSMERLFEPVKDDMIFIASNGAYVCQNGNTIQECLLDWENVSRWVRDVRQIPGSSFVMDTKEGFYTESMDAEFMDRMQSGYRNNIIWLEDILAQKRKVSKLGIYQKENRGETVAFLIPRWKNRLCCVRSGKAWLDFMSPGTNKGSALQELQKKWGISPDETMVFGDNENDLEMFLSASESYAVGNAAQAVINAARYTTDTNVNDGVLKVLRTLLD